MLIVLMPASTVCDRFGAGTSRRWTFRR